MSLLFPLCAAIGRIPHPPDRKSRFALPIREAGKVAVASAFRALLTALRVRGHGVGGLLPCHKLRNASRHPACRRAMSNVLGLLALPTPLERSSVAPRKQPPSFIIRLKLPAVTARSKVEVNAQHGSNSLHRAWSREFVVTVEVQKPDVPRPRSNLFVAPSDDPEGRRHRLLRLSHSSTVGLGSRDTRALESTRWL